MANIKKKSKSFGEIKIISIFAIPNQERVSREEGTTLPM